MGAFLSSALYAVSLAGGLALSIYPLVSKREQAPRWSKSAVALLGVAFICWSVLGFAGLWFASSVSPAAIYLISRFRTVVGGIAIGIFLVLCLAGEMKITRRSRS